MYYCYTTLVDWGRRPLSDEALYYAATDVRHLLALQETLDQRLQSLGRTAWVAEECARLEEVRYTAPDLENAYLSVKGAKNLDGRGFAILRSLFLFREEEARRQHRPPFFVMPDVALIYLATTPTVAFSEVPGLGQAGMRRFGRGLQQALRDGLAAPPIHSPPPMTSDGWGLCRKEGHCTIEDDFQSLVKKIKASDVVVFANPVYFGDLTESMRGFLDRLRRIGFLRRDPEVPRSIPAVGLCYAGGSGNGAPNCCASLDRILQICGFDVVDMVPLRRQNLEAKLPALEIMGKWLVTKPTSGQRLITPSR